MAGSHASVVHASSSSHTMASTVHPSTGSQPSVVHAFSSSQSDGVLTQPMAGSHASVVHASESSQSGAEPPLQLPSKQRSPFVQGSPSLHSVWSASHTTEHAPLTGSHDPAWHGLSGLSQPTTVAWSTTQNPSEQANVPLHRSPSSKSTQSESFWHSHSTSVAAQAPPVQMSPPEHTLPSLHGCPSSSSISQAPVAVTQPAFAHWESPVVSQTMIVSGSIWQLASMHRSCPLQRSSSSKARQSACWVHGHSTAAPAQAKSRHASPSVHGSPSSHGALLAVTTQPEAGSQASSEHGLPSSQVTALPPAHAPSRQKLSSVHASPSSQPV